METLRPTARPTCSLPGERRAGRRPRVAAGLRAAAAVSLVLVGAAAAAAQSSDQQLEQFLTRLGLVDLQTVHLEEVLQRDLPADQRERTAQRLADLYANQLVAHSSDPDRQRDVLQRIDQLVQKFPQAKTPSLEVMLLQADYYRAEQLVGTWNADRQATAARDQAAEILARIAPRLLRYYQQLKADADKLGSEVDALAEGDELEELEVKQQTLYQLQSVAGRAGYFAAWSNYYLALTGQGGGGGGDFRRARDLFRQLLGLSGEYEEDEAEYLGLESVWRARALIGLGLAEAAAGNLAASDTCFDWLEKGAADAQLKDQAAYWRLQALLDAGRLDLAGELARRQVAALPTTATQGRVSFCVSLVRAGYGSGTAVSDSRRQLALLGIAGLIKLRQRGAVRSLMEQYNIQPDDSAGFYLRWIKGQQLFEQAEQSKAAADYQAAAAALQSALEAPEAKDDLGGAGQCQNQLAWCHYRLEQFEPAARAFEKAATARRAAGDEGAVDSAWMAFVSYQKLIKRQPRFVSATINVLRQLKSDYPQHAYAQRVDYYISKLQQNAASTAETLADLERVPPASADYLLARYDICTLLHQQWTQATGRQQAAAAARLNAAVDRYLQAARQDADNVRKVKVCLLAAAVALAGDPPAAAKYLDQAEPWVATLAAGNAAAAEYHYRRLQLAQKSGDQAAQRRHAQWLADNAQGSAYELSGLITAAKNLDAAIKAAGARVSDDQQQQAHRVYARLAEVLGDTPEAIAGNANARVALSKAAHYAHQLGHYDEAAQRLDKLLAAQDEGPKNRDYLRRAGLAHFAAAAYDRSIPHWRTLLAGLSKGSQAWYEAKYYQLACLSHTDPSKFQQALAQFRLLYPSVPSPWKEKIAALGP